MTPHRGYKWLEWIRKNGGSEADFGGRDRIRKDHSTIESAIRETVSTARKGTKPTWEKNEIIAYFDAEGNMGLGKLILASRLTTFKKIELNTQGEAYEVRKIVTIPTQAYDEKGEEVTGDPIWKVRWARELPPDARTKRPKDKEETKEK